MKHTPFLDLTLAFLILLLAACTGKQHYNRNGEGEPIPISYAENLKLIQHEGYTEAIERNPWDTTAVLQTYILVPRDQAVPDSLPAGVVVRVPVQNALVYSSVHCSLLCELGAEFQIGGVCDAEYIYQPELKARLEQGSLLNCGNSMAPNLEQIIQMRPEAIFLSPYEDSNGYGKLDKLNIPLVLCADYMETSPLGRAEWAKFYGLLFGKSEEAGQLFSQIETRYNSLKAQAQQTTSRPKVLCDTRYGQVWYMPGGYSTQGRMLEDAGALNPFGYLQQSGSAPLAAEQVYEKAHDADVWILKYNQPTDKTLQQLGEDDALYKQFRPFKEGNVYGSNTSTSFFYEQTPYHPDLLLRDYIQILHPELGLEGELRYFKKLE